MPKVGSDKNATVERDAFLQCKRSLLALHGMFGDQPMSAASQSGHGRKIASVAIGPSRLGT